MRLLLALLFLLTVSQALAQTFTISGTIKSAATGESMINVSVVSGKNGTTSNEYGFYSLPLEKGLNKVVFTTVGYEVFTKEVEGNADLQIDVFLNDLTKNLDDIVITATRRGRSITNPQMGVERLSTEEIKSIPVIFGEKDILKTIQLLPGVKSAGDGNSGFFVRGGAADQNLILLDEAPVYNASHLLGFFSTFNSEAVKDMALYKGGMPAQYGGRLSGVLDIKMNEGNNQDYSASGGIGLISSRLNLEGPIQKGQSSFLLSGRRTYADLFLKLSNDSSINQNILYFYDLNAKMNISLGKKDKLYFSGYFGKDVLGVGRTFGINWGNGTGTIRWNHIYNPKLFANTSLIFSNYNYKISIESGGDNFDILSQIRDINLKHEYQYFVNARNSYRIGLNAMHHTISPGEVKAKASFSVNNAKLQERYSLENAAYVSNTRKLSDKLNLTLGLRLSAFTVFGRGDYYSYNAEGGVTDTFSYKKGEIVKTYFNPEPRLSASFILNASSSIKTSYARNTQSLHLLSSSTSANPTDKWIASTNVLKPEISEQVSLGYYRDLKDKRYELSIETYFKTLLNQIDYRDGANIFENNNAIESQLLIGKGRAYGIEGLFKKTAGRFTGWLSYTLSKTERLINGINNNTWYPARQDRTHDLALVGMYKLSSKWTFSANWVYYTGDAVTFPAGKYKVNGQTLFYYTDRNSYRMPDYHRLDVGATWILKDKPKFSSELNISLYNAYGRENAFAINFREKKDDPNVTEAVRFALFKFIPSVSYNFKIK